MTRSRQEQIGQAAIIAGLLVGSCLPAYAQYTTLRDPLIPGAISTPAGAPAPLFPPPPPGCGPTPYPVNPGMSGGPGYEPQVPYLPATQIDQSDSYFALPSPSTTSAPGQLGPSINTPYEPDTPGSDPGNLAPNNSGYNPPAANVQVNSGGGLPADSAPTSKWGGQTTQDFGNGLRQGSGVCDFGQLLINKPDLAKQPQFSQDGPIPMQQVSDTTTPVRGANQTKAGAGQETTDPGLRQLVHNQMPVQTQAQY